MASDPPIDVSQVRDFSNLTQPFGGATERFILNGIVSVIRMMVSNQSLLVTSFPGLREDSDFLARDVEQHVKELVATNLQSDFHPNVVPFLGFASVSDFPALISPWWDEVDVAAYIRAHPSVDRLALTYDVAEGLQHLHSLSIIHGDLRLGNVIVNENGVAMLRGFGLVEILDDRCLELFTPRYSAPELLESIAPSFESDAYSCAAVILYILTGRHPYHSIKRDTAAVAAQARKIALSKDDYPGLDDGIWQGIVSAMNPNPDDRADTIDLINTIIENDRDAPAVISGPPPPDPPPPPPPPGAGHAEPPPASPTDSAHSHMPQSTSQDTDEGHSSPDDDDHPNGPGPGPGSGGDGPGDHSAPALPTSDPHVDEDPIGTSEAIPLVSIVTQPLPVERDFPSPLAHDLSSAAPLQPVQSASPRPAPASMATTTSPTVDPEASRIAPVPVIAPVAPMPPSLLLGPSAGATHAHTEPKVETLDSPVLGEVDRNVGSSVPPHPFSSNASATGKPSDESVERIIDPSPSPRPRDPRPYSVTLPAAEDFSMPSPRSRPYSGVPSPLVEVIRPDPVVTEVVHETVPVTPPRSPQPRRGGRLPRSRKASNVARSSTSSPIIPEIPMSPALAQAILDAAQMQGPNPSPPGSGAASPYVPPTQLPPPREINLDEEFDGSDVALSPPMSPKAKGPRKRRRARGEGQSAAGSAVDSGSEYAASPVTSSLALPLTGGGDSPRTQAASPASRRPAPPVPPVAITSSSSPPGSGAPTPPHRPSRPQRSGSTSQQGSPSLVANRALAGAGLAAPRPSSPTPSTSASTSSQPQGTASPRQATASLTAGASSSQSPQTTPQHQASNLQQSRPPPRPTPRKQPAASPASPASQSPQLAAVSAPSSDVESPTSAGATGGAKPRRRRKQGGGGSASAN